MQNEFTVGIEYGESIDEASVSAGYDKIMPLFDLAFEKKSDIDSSVDFYYTNIGEYTSEEVFALYSLISFYYSDDETVTMGYAFVGVSSQHGQDVSRKFSQREKEQAFDWVVEKAIEFLGETNVEDLSEIDY